MFLTVDVCFLVLPLEMEYIYDPLRIPKVRLVCSSVRCVEVMADIARIVVDYVLREGFRRWECSLGKILRLDLK